MTNLFFSNTLTLGQPITIDKITTSRSGVQDLIVTHYDYSPQHITNMQSYKLDKIGECKIKPTDCQILPAQVAIIISKPSSSSIRYTCET